MSVADVVVLPSTAREPHSEVWGLVVNEAASLGKPVVVTEAVGSASDLVAKFQCGSLVKHSDPHDLCQAIRQILLDPELALKMGANGISATRETFNFERMAQGFYHAIQQAFAKTRECPTMTQSRNEFPVIGP